MGVPAFNIASSVTLIMAQRLARKLCDHCKAPEVVPEAELLELAPCMINFAIFSDINRIS
uniref:ATPase, T2SS/T4P/T4SS family n=1 Tax=Aeromonas dhakensis TaxID=196024 RepID=UPI001FCAB0CF